MRRHRYRDAEPTVVIPAPFDKLGTGIQDKRRAVSLAPRFRGGDELK
jgi:hypothetical protein